MYILDGVNEQTVSYILKIFFKKSVIQNSFELLLMFVTFQL